MIILCLFALIFKGTIARRGAFFGMGSGPIFLEQLRCPDGIATLLECARPPLGIQFCDHSMDAGVTCIGMMAGMEHSAVPK